MSECKNTFLSVCKFECGDGYKLTGAKSVTCLSDGEDDDGKGEWTNDPATCVDIDECDMDYHECDSRNSDCRDTDGGYECDCFDGWTGDFCDEEIVQDPVPDPKPDPIPDLTVALNPVVPDLTVVVKPVVPVSTIPGLMCYECQSSVSNQDCIKRGRLAKCQSNQGSCQNTVRINHGRLQIIKGCKQTQACR